MGFGCGKVVWARNKDRLRTWWKTIYRQPLDHVAFQSDGVLTAQWAKPFLHDLPRNVDIMDIDIFAIRRRIESCPQVRSVVVERQYPDVVKITVQERVPILRLLINDGQSPREMLIDKEGVIFHGEMISEAERRALPFLGGVILKRTKDGSYEKIPALDKVYRLLHIARTKYWPIYAQMEVISIEKLKKKTVPWSKISVRCQCASAIIFGDNDFDEQLKRLDFILNTPKIRNRLPVERIDLSLGGDAVVKFGP
ncbi:MAG: FtsQ-type POTRA domain-containing protein [Puniceicoccales bacterium]|nr:FtsQ-type POTRA domain-containing protein [Puniceicoccales bacterium]